MSECSDNFLSLKKKKRLTLVNLKWKGYCMCGKECVCVCVGGWSGVGRYSMSGLSPTMCPGDLTQSDSSGTLIGRTKLFFLMKFDLFVPEMSSEQQQKRLSCLREQLNIGHSDI